MDHFCHCRDCKKAKRKGLILGSRWERSWKNGLMRVSAYVPYHRFVKGRKPDVSFDPSPFKDNGDYKCVRQPAT